MKNINIKIAALIFISASINSTDYDNAKFENYVSGQGVNTVIAEAQLIVCKLSKLGTKELAGDGSYKATIFADECTETGGSGDSSQGTTAPSSSQSGGSSSSSSSAETVSNTTKEIESVFVNTGFLTNTVQTTKGWVVNDKPFNEQTNRQPKNITYLLNEQTAPADDTSKFGTFTLRYQASTFGNTQETLPEWYTCPPENSRDYKYSWCSDGADLGRGLIIADGSLIKFKSDIQGSDQQNMVAQYSENGDIAGIYTRQTGFQDESLRNPDCDGLSDGWWECQSEEYRNSNTTILGIFSFGISATSETYCTKMSELYKVDWQNYDEETDGPTLTTYTLSGQPLERLGKEGWDVAEKCFSISKADAVTNVFDYGVYNEDGSNLSLTNQSFPIKATVQVNEVDRRVHGYASYWGVHVQDEYQNIVTDTTEWKKDNDSDSTDKFNVKPRKIQIRKSEKTFMPLNELDGLSLNFWTNDSYWSEEFQKLGFAAIDPWEGKIQFKSSKAVFTDYNDGSASDPLNYALYGYHDGVDALIVDLVGAKIDKDNLTKIIDNDPSDPGKAMNLTMEFSEFPDYSTYPNGKRESYIAILLCTGSSINYTRRTVYDANQINIASDQMCLNVSGPLNMSSDGTTMTLSTKSKSSNGNYNAMFKDGSSGVTLYFNQDNWNNAGYEYDFIVQKTGIERPAGMEIKLSNLLSAFGGLSQGDDNGGDLSSGLKSFLNSSDTFTFLVSRYEDTYDHMGQPFNNVYGTFGVSSTPSPAVFVDDVKVTEPTTSTASAFPVSLSKAQASDVTFDYVISGSSTASAADYTNLTAGTATITAGQTSTTIPFNVEADNVAEGLDDEKIILTLSNPSAGIVLGRTNPTAYIYDDDTNRVVYDDYAGSFNAETATFTVTDGMKFYPSYEKVTLPAPITFTVTDWLTNMKKIYNAGSDYEETRFRELNVWSPDTNSSYSITKNSFENPTSGTQANGVSTVADSIIKVTELPAELYCIERCMVSSLVNSHYTNLKGQADPAGDGTYTGSVTTAGPSPYSSVTGPYIKEDMTVVTKYNEGQEDEYTETRDWTKGQWVDSVVASEMTKYTVEGDTLKDGTGDEIILSLDWGIARPYDKLQGAHFLSPEGRQEGTQWGVGSWDLVDAATLPKLECTFSTDDDGNKIYQNENPQYTTANGKASETRYCASRRWESNEILVRYTIEIQTHKQYEIFKTDGSAVAFDPPKRLYFEAPNTAAFGENAGKKFMLDYQGDHLGGIPGNVVDIDTGESLGEYVNEWKDSYRWVPKFTIPDGSLLTENTSDKKYKVKKLRGEEFLGKKDSAIGSLEALLTSKTKSDLLTNRDLRFEVSVREENQYDCSLKKTVTYTDGDGNTYDQEETDWDLCHSEEYIDDTTVWTLVRSFANCTDAIAYETDRIQADLDQAKADTIANGGTWDGPNTWQELVEEEPENFEWLTNRLSECKTIGTIPTFLINGGEPAVVNGEVVFDPTPSE